MLAELEIDKVKERRRRERLTDKRLERLSAGFGEREEIADDIVRELRVRVGKSGTKTWSVLYRVAGRGEGGKAGAMKRLSLGSFPSMSVGDARTKAREILEMAGKGIDPAAIRTEEIVLRQTRTFEAVLERYIEVVVKPHTKDGRWAAGQEARARKDAEESGSKMRKVGRCPADRLLSDYVAPRLRGRMIETITLAELDELLDDILRKKGVSTAREVRKHLAGLFNWAARRNLIIASPTAGLRKKELKYVPRKRELSMNELRRVWDATGGEHSYPFGDMVRLLILTGQRRSEIAGLRREWFDEDDERLVVIPAEEYKTGEEHSFPLSDPAWRLIEGMPRWNEGPFLFSTQSGLRPVSGFSKAKAALDRRIAERGEADGLEPMQPWTLHDLRRTVTTQMVRIGIREQHIERVLGHKIGGVAGVYNRYSYLKEKRDALEQWGAELEKEVGKL